MELEIVLEFWAEETTLELLELTTLELIVEEIVELVAELELATAQALILVDPAIDKPELGQGVATAPVPPVQ